MPTPSFQEIANLLTGAFGVMFALLFALIAGAKGLYVWRWQYNDMNTTWEERYKQLLESHNFWRDRALEADGRMDRLIDVTDAALKKVER